MEQFNTISNSDLLNPNLPQTTLLGPLVPSLSKCCIGTLRREA